MEVYVVYYEDLIGCTEITIFSTREKAQKWIDRRLDYDPEGDYDIGIHYIDDEDIEDYEHDGQPDEAQEWHDFDPDC